MVVSIVDSHRLEFPILNSCTIHRRHQAIDWIIRTDDLRKSMYTLCQSDLMFPYTFFLSIATTTRNEKKMWHTFVVNKSRVRLNLPFSSNINSATVLDHSWLIALKNSATLLCHSKLNTVYIFSSSVCAVFTFCGIRFHRKRALQLKSIIIITQILRFCFSFLCHFNCKLVGGETTYRSFL